MAPLRFALPNKGSLSAPAAQMLAEAGYRVNRSGRELIVADPANDVQFFFLRPRDIAVYVGEGSLDVGITGSHYFHKLDPVESPVGGEASERRIPWRIDLGGRMEVRLFRGFFVNFGGNYQWIRDQLHIPLEDIDDEDILLELQQLATDFSYQTSLGIRYRFGSIFSETVNPRFGGGGRD